MKINGSSLRRNPGAPARPHQAFSFFVLLGAMLFLLSNLSSLNAELATLTVAVDTPAHAISPTLYGIFFEDINCSADGGLYAEMVRNRNCEDSDTPDYWTALSAEPKDVAMSVDPSEPVSAKNPHSLKVEVNHASNGRAGVVNDGFWGMALA